MDTDNNKSMSLTKFCFAGFSSKTGCLTLMFVTLLLLIPTVARADGLFDFQMTLAKKGNAEAQFKVGEMYETGFGVNEDKAEAMNWINKAAAQGNENAGFKLLYWDIEKNGVTTANRAEFEILKTKANEGNPQAEYYLGKMYSRGIGVKQDPDKAISWLNKAALVGVLEAEREAVFVKEDKQEQMRANKINNEQKRLELKAKEASEDKAKLEQQRKLQEQKQAEAKTKADKIAEQNKARNKASAEANKEAAEKDEKQRLLAQQQAIAKQQETEKQALVIKREAEQKQRKIEFESDPCSGKSARFLSTCR